MVLLIHCAQGVKAGGGLRNQSITTRAMEDVFTARFPYKFSASAVTKYKSHWRCEVDEKLKEISERAEKAANAVSDDFGHSVTECTNWQVLQLYQIDKDVQKLIQVIRVQSEALERLSGFEAARLCLLKTKEILGEE
jgi:hypothetical protein